MREERRGASAENTEEVVEDVERVVSRELPKCLFGVDLAAFLSSFSPPRDYSVIYFRLAKIYTVYRYIIQGDLYI